MPADYEARLERLEMAWGIGPTLHLWLLPSENKAAKLAEVKRAHGLMDDDTVQVIVHEIVFVEWPLRDSAHG
jgi:hypothetical protein